MKNEKKKLSDAELEIMMEVWEAGEPVTSNYILERLKGKREWALSTLMTVLSRLAGKGYLNCDRSTRTNYYSALVSEGEYKASEGKGILERLYGNSVTNLVVNLCDEKSISEEELLKLRHFLDTYQGDQDE
ncbi:MAG: BlaI/MecI/CopY family transcriptional regulator [Lachnospiraceae bacterium]|nr:BlaI/MecI/CopY family transcriptional regulator [Lachnospiraceae bacterium]